jgi:phosphate ABC transporter phosphate-binding protein
MILRRLGLVAAAVASMLVGIQGTLPASAASYVPISGSGSTWSYNALDGWRRNVGQYGMTINFAATGSSDGRNQFKNGTVDFAVSEIPYGLTDGGVFDVPPKRPYAYMPIVAGGTAFMYNLKIGNNRVTNLRLSGEAIAKIFTGVITSWDDPLIASDNPGFSLPARKIVPVVRSDGSGTTAQFTTWMSKQYPSLWDNYCGKAGRSTPCGVTSNFPVVPGSGFTAQSGSTGVSGYVKQAHGEGAITYVEYSYALKSGFPVAKVLNKAGYYVEPKASNVAVGLLGATINTDENSPDYLTQNLTGVYNNADKRAYPLSSYSYMILPTSATGSFNTEKGKTLGAFSYYFLCEGQQQADVLGYSPLPINLVQAGLDQVRRIPGADLQSVDIARCNNPTFSGDGSNTLAKNAPQPPDCDAQGPNQCGTGTGGAKTPTPTTGGSGSGGSGGSKGGSGANGGSAGGGGSPGNLNGGGSPGGDVPGGDGGGAVVGDGSDGGSTDEPVIDPDTGETVTVGAGSGSGGGRVSAVPVALAARSGWDTQRSLMLLAGVLLLAVVVGPPVAARVLASRRGA